MAQNNTKNQFVVRQIQEKVAQHLDQPEMTIILGPRQVGKTILLEQLQDWLLEQKKIDPRLIFYFNLDIVQDWEKVKDQTRFINFIKERSQNQKIYIFIDEAQKVENPGSFYKGIYDSQLNAKLILTGSASLYFASQVKESMAGRKRIFYLHPFSFEEYLKAKHGSFFELTQWKENVLDYNWQDIKNFYKDYLIWGGYPRVVLAQDEEAKKTILSDIYSSYVERDIVGFLKIKNKSKFNKLVSLLAGQIGQLVNINELASLTELNRDTVYRYITTLEETYIIAQLTPYFNNPRQEIIKNPKIYFLDNGLRNHFLGNFNIFDNRGDVGSLFENSFLQELIVLKQEWQRTIHFWRTKQGAEVDFVVEQETNLIPIELKVNLKLPKSGAGLQNFIKKYKPASGLMVNLSGLSAKATIGKTNVNFISPVKIKNFIR